MPETYNAAQCPHCRSLNVSPGKKLWHCNDCGKDFDQAMVQIEPPKEQKKGGKQ